MKNKNFPKLLHRLPVLLLALILAVMPLTMAAPAHADVLTGSFYLSGLGFDFRVSPILDNMVLVYYEDYAGPMIAYLASEESFQLTYDYTSPGTTSSFVSVSGFNGYRGSKVLREPIVSPIIIDYVVPVSNADLTYRKIYGVLVYGDVTYAGNITFPVIELRSDPGVLDIFSGVGAWLSGAVQNIFTMFWTAESGMSVLGYLAVASLALAVILLIFYLIAGWLKFH